MWEMTKKKSIYMYMDERREQWRIKCEFYILTLIKNKCYWYTLDDSDYSILEDPLPDGVKSTLVIRTSQEKDFGPYNCSVTNQYGTHVMEIYLMKQSKLDVQG